METYYLNNNLPILHGEAVAIGMIAEIHLSEQRLGLSSEEKNTLIRIIDIFFERKDIPANGMDEILKNLEQDKKNKDSEIQVVLLKEIGLPKHSIIISRDEVKEALTFYATK